MKTASLAFLALLLFAHRTVAPDEALGLPLSMFRDGPAWEVGYALFGLLLLIAGLMIWPLLRGQFYGHAGLFCAAALFLALVAATPSLNGIHGFYSLVLFAVLYGYYAVLLRGAQTAWFWAHLAVPVLLLVATGCHSYGLWQKCFIVYLLLAANVQHHLVGKLALLWSEPAGRRGPLGRRRPAAWLPRKRVVYVLEVDKNWARRREPRASASAG